MRHILTRLGLGLALSLPFLSMAAVSPAAADQNASVTISDKGFTPANVTVGLGGSVSFTNSGSIVHTASSTGGAPLAFNTGGLAPSQSTSISFSLPGTYPFNSATDCLNGNTSRDFNCSGGSVTVTATGAAAPSVAPAPTVTAPPPITVGSTAAVPAGAAQQTAAVSITDTGVTPASVNIAQGGTVTWTNSGKQVHTATTTGSGNPVPFDSGGLGSGQSQSLVFATSGTYTYTSATDCIDKSNPGGFGCGPYTIVVGNAPAAQAPSTTTSSASPAPVVANTTVTIDDKNGFTPNTLTIRVGQTVTWTNTGNNVHTSSSNPGFFNAWDSGGLSKGQSFSKTFTLAGTYGYHSQTEPIYTTDTTTGNVTVSYMFNGTIVAQ